MLEELKRRAIKLMGQNKSPICGIVLFYEKVSKCVEASETMHNVEKMGMKKGFFQTGKLNYEYCFINCKLFRTDFRMGSYTDVLNKISHTQPANTIAQQTKGTVLQSPLELGSL